MVLNSKYRKYPGQCGKIAAVSVSKVVLPLRTGLQNDISTLTFLYVFQIVILLPQFSP